MARPRRRSETVKQFRQTIRRTILLLQGSLEILLAFAVYLLSGLVLTNMLYWARREGLAFPAWDHIVVSTLQVVSSVGFLWHGLVVIAMGMVDIGREGHKHIFRGSR